MNKKYKLTNKYITLYSGRTLYRIQAIKDFSDVKKGDLGGYIESEYNLSHKGDCWVYNNAQVYGKAEVGGLSIICGNSRIYGNAYIFSSMIDGNFYIHKKARIIDVDSDSVTDKIY